MLKEGKLDKKKITNVILVGGSTKIPKIQQLINEYFKGKDKIYKINSVNAQAYGATLIGAVHCYKGRELCSKLNELVLNDSIPFSLGIANNNIYPSDDNHNFIWPFTSPKTSRGGMTIIVPKNSPLPTKKSKKFISVNNQTSYKITIYEIESKVFLGELVLDLSPPLSKDKIEIEITFNSDINFGFIVTAVEKLSGRSNNTFLHGSKLMILKKNKAIYLKLF